MPRVGVVGGSLGGLTAALVLRDAGCAVEIYERSSSAPDARGAGIAMLEPTLRYPIERAGHAIESLCSTTAWIRFLGDDGASQHEQRHRYHFSSWNTVYRALLASFDPAHYHLGHELTSVATCGPRVSAAFANGMSTEVDLLIGADGISSTVRSILLPDVAPVYAGYVAWRGVLPERELSAATFDALHDALTYQLLPSSHLLAYPIPGPGGATAPGERLMNLVWYRNVDTAGLTDLLTDRDGHRRAVSVPPGAMRPDAVAEMRASASRMLAPALAEVVTGITEPFVQAVFDLEVPRMAVGRMCLLGDAAFAVRPHAAAGTAKAAEDGWVLAEELLAANGDLDGALVRWEQRQLALGRGLLTRTRDIGNRSQFTAEFRPGDQRLIFGLYGPNR